MNYDCETETSDYVTLQAHLTARADAGWRLVEAFAHPTETLQEQPKIITFWERERVE